MLLKFTSACFKIFASQGLARKGQAHLMKYKNYFLMKKSSLNQRTKCLAELLRHGWCIGLLTVESKLFRHAQNPTKAALPRAVRFAALEYGFAALNDLKSVYFFGLQPYSRPASQSIAPERPVLCWAWAPKASFSLSSSSCLPSPPLFS